MEEKELIVKLDRHEARKTSAATRWFVRARGEVYELQEAEEKGLVKFVGSTHDGNKTHWDEYYEVLGDVTFLRVRVSNRGNVTKTDLLPRALKASREEVEAIRLINRAD
jgi:hypothetical protein